MFQARKKKIDVRAKRIQTPIVDVICRKQIAFSERIQANLA